MWWESILALDLYEADDAAEAEDDEEEPEDDEEEPDKDTYMDHSSSRDLGTLSHSGGSELGTLLLDGPQGRSRSMDLRIPASTAMFLHLMSNYIA